MADPAAFASRIGSIASNVPKRADIAVKKAALAAVSAVITATPVDTGRARANWIVSMDVSSESVRDTLGTDPSAAIADAVAKIATYNGNINRSIHITNNLPYIGRLNEGSSSQAPAGFVEKSIRVAIQSVRGARLLRVGG